jgi:hypothetical protein
MKRSILVVALFLAVIGLKANTGGESTSYVRTDNKVYFGQDVKIGLFNTKIVSSDGTVTKIPDRDVRAYMSNSSLFEYLPVVCEKNEILSYTLMKYVTTRSGLNVYRYINYDNKESTFSYYVFKEGNFYVGIDNKNAKTTLPFFGINPEGIL